MLLCMSWTGPKSPFVDMSCAVVFIVTCHEKSTCKNPECFEYTYASERESHVYSFTFAKRPQLGTKPKSNINSLNPGGERMNERECVRVRVYGRNGDGDGA